MRKLGIVVNIVGVAMLVAGLTGKLNTSYETDVLLIQLGAVLGLVGLGIIASATWKKHRSR